MNYLAILKLVLELFPLIIEAVKKVEEASGKSGEGASKLELVKSVLTDTVEIGQVVDQKQYISAVEKTISLVVKFFNATGVFKK